MLQIQGNFHPSLVNRGSVTTIVTSQNLQPLRANFKPIILRLTGKTMTKSNRSQSGITPTKQMEVSANIDWISVTYDFHDNLKDYCRVMPDDHNGKYEIVKGANGYREAKRYQSGAIEMWHGNYPEMGIHVVYTAQAIAYACENFGCEQWEILDYLSQTAKLSRLDIALDVANVPIDIRQMHSDALAGKIKTRAKKIDYVERAEIGSEYGARTLYFGSMTKRKKLLRVYDKGMQLNLDNYLTRFELECHGQIAQNATKTLLGDIEALASNIQAMIAGYVDFKDTIPYGVFSGDKVKIALPKYAKSNTAQWLLDTVAKTLANEVYSDRELFSEFIDKFQFWLNKRISEELDNK